MDGKEDRIRQLAHGFWLEEGKPEGQAVQHWERARRQVEAQETAETERASAGTQTPSREKTLEKTLTVKREKKSAVEPKAKGPSRSKGKRSSSDQTESAK
jgi:hypothetical protein